MKVTPVLLFVNLFLLGSICDSAIPVASNKNKFVSAVVNPVPLNIPNNLECDACEFIAKALDDKVFHNDRLIVLAQTELDNICNVLPTDAKDLCLVAVNNTVPGLLGKIGDYVAEEGCEELGICKNTILIS